MAGDLLFLDTSLIIAATVEAHPAHKASAAFVDDCVADGQAMCISLQVCREFLVVLTRQPVTGRVFTLDESLDALRDLADRMQRAGGGRAGASRVPPSGQAVWSARQASSRLQHRGHHESACSPPIGYPKCVGLQAIRT